jgi:hypothetical protein
LGGGVAGLKTAPDGELHFFEIHFSTALTDEV